MFPKVSESFLGVPCPMDYGILGSAGVPQLMETTISSRNVGAWG